MMRMLDALSLALTILTLHDMINNYHAVDRHVHRGAQLPSFHLLRCECVPGSCNGVFRCDEAVGGVDHRTTQRSTRPADAVSTAGPTVVAPGAVHGGHAAVLPSVPHLQPDEHERVLP